MSPDELALLIEKRIAETNERLSAFNAARSSGSATTNEWLEAVRVELKNTYIQFAELGKGGRDLITAQDWGRIGGDLADQYKFLQGFAQEIDADLNAEGMSLVPGAAKFIANPFGDLHAGNFIMQKFGMFIPAQGQEPKHDRPSKSFRAPEQ